MTNTKTALRTIEEVVEAMKGANIRTQTIKAVAARLEVAGRTVVDVEELFSFTKSAQALEFSKTITIDFTSEQEFEEVILYGVNAVARTNQEFKAIFETKAAQLNEAKRAADSKAAQQLKLEMALINEAHEEVLNQLESIESVTESSLVDMVFMTMDSKLAKKDYLLANKTILEGITMKSRFVEGFNFVGQYCSLKDQKVRRLVAKENVLYNASEVKEKLQELGAEEVTIKAVTQLLIARGGSFANKKVKHEGKYVNMTSIILNDDPALKMFAENYVIKPERKKMKQYATYSISADGLIKDESLNGEIHIPSLNQLLQSQSESVLFNTVAVPGEMVSIKSTGEVNEDEGRIVTLYRMADETDEVSRTIASATNIMVLSEDGNTEVYADAIRNGIYLNGQKYSYLLESTSQKRQIKATFVREDFGRETVAIYREKLGITAKHFMDPETKVFDLKSNNRHGLVSSGTTDMDALNQYLDAPFTTRKVNETMYEILVHAQNPVKFLVVDDVKVVIEKGDAYALDITNSIDQNDENFKKADSFHRADAKTLGLTQDLSDGGALMDPELFNIIERSVGYPVGAIQFRENHFSMKGMINKVRTRAKTGYHGIFPRSVFKGQLQVLGDAKEARLQFRLAGQPRQIGKEDKLTNLPNQVLSAIGLTPEISNTFADAQLDKYRQILKDPKKAADFVDRNLFKLKIEDALSEEHKEEIESASITHTASRFILANPAVIKDAYIRKSLYNTMKKQVGEFNRGQFEVPANYKYMTHDILLFLDVVAYNLKNPDAQIMSLTEDIAKEKGFNYIPSGRILLMNSTGKSFIKNKKALLARMPLAHKGETVVAKTYVAYNYVDQLRYEGMTAFGAGMIFFSAFDFNAFAMGGGDFDGDKALITLVKEIVEYVEKYKKENNILPILDFSVILGDNNEVIKPIEGCPWSSPAQDLKLETEIPGLIQQVDQDGVYTNKFLIDEENYSLETEILLAEHTARLASESLEGNNIGKYTNYALTIEDAISHSTALLKGEDGRELTEAQVEALTQEIEKLESQLGLVLMALKYDLDKAKHGGAFEDYLELDFLTEDISTLLCQYTKHFEDGQVKYVPFVNKAGKRRMKKLPWLQGIYGINSDNFLENAEELRNRRNLTKSVMANQMVYNNTLWQDFVLAEDNQKLFNPKESNLLSEMSAFALNKEVLELANVLAVDMIAMYRNRVKAIGEKAEELANYYGKTELEKDIIRDKYFSKEYSKLVDKIRLIVANVAQSNKHVFGYEVALAVRVYQLTYSTKSRIPSNIRKAEEAFSSEGKVNAFTRGLAAPFMIVQDQMVEALSILGSTEELKAFNEKAMKVYEVAPQTRMVLDVSIDEYFRTRALKGLSDEYIFSNKAHAEEARAVMNGAVNACLHQAQGVLEIDTEVQYFGEVEFELPVVKFNGITTPLGGVADVNRSLFLSLKGRQLGVNRLINVHHSFVKMEVVVL